MNIWRRARKLIVDSNKKTVDYAQSKTESTDQTMPKPKDESEAKSTEQTKAKQAGETWTKSVIQTKPNPKEESEPKSAEQAKPKPKDESEAKSTEQTKDVPTGETWTKSAAQTKPKQKEESEPKSAKQTKPEPKDESGAKSTEQTKDEPTGETWTKSAAQTKPKSKDEIELKSAEQTKPETKDESGAKSTKQTKPKQIDEFESKSEEQTKAEPKDESDTKSTEQTKVEPIGQFKTESTAQTKAKPTDQSKTESTAKTKSKHTDQSKTESLVKKTPEPIQLISIKNELKDIDDAVFKDYQTTKGLVTIVYLSSLIDLLTLHKIIVLPLMNDSEEIFNTFETVAGENRQLILLSITNGDTILYYHDQQQFLKGQTFSPPERTVSSSETESTVIGPQDSFTESLRTNLSLIKKRIHQPGLKSKDRIIGKETNTKISILYIERLVNNENLQRIEKRIKELDYDGFVDITILNQLVEDNPFSPFPQFGVTSRPDAAVSSLLDGRIVIAMENSQSVMICPYSFIEMFNSPEDFYNRWSTASLLRILRFAGFFITIMLTPMYISALTYHPGILPFELLIMIQESRSKVPFPPVIEVLFIELVIEILREAGSRMPTKIGQTIGIVGGIVIGTAAVEANLVSNTLIVLVAISALLSFLLPNFLMSNASRVVRYIFILAAGMFGLIGQMLALAWLFNHLLNLTSLGTPYMTPVIPRAWSDMYSSIIRLPLGFIQKRTGISRAKQVKKDSK